MAQDRETELDIGVLAGALWRKAWLLLLLAFLAAVATYAALLFVEPLYTADARVLIEERESPLTRPRDETADPSSLQYDESGIQSQVEVFRSREIGAAVVDRLDLTHRPEFDPGTRPSPLSRLLVLVGLKEHPVDETIRQRIMAAYFDRLSVYPIGKSRVIGVEFEAGDPDLAADVTNAVVEAFIDLQQQAKRETALAATTWLEGEIARLRGKVSESEEKIAEYRRTEGLYQVSGSGGTLTGNLSTQQLGDLNAELARAKAARSEAEARAQLIRSLIATQGSLEASPEVLQSPLIQRLQERQVALQAEIADLSTTLLPAHPRIRALDRQLANLEGQIRQEADKILRSLDTAARVAAAREQSLEESLSQAKSDASQSNQREIELRALEREAAAQRDLLETLLGRYREASARTDAGYLPADARVISRAVAPQNPSFPRKGMMSVAAAFGALLLGASVIMLREFTSGRVFRGGGEVLPAHPEPASRETAGTFAFLPPEPEESGPPPAAEPEAEIAEPAETETDGSATVEAEDAAAAAFDAEDAAETEVEEAQAEAEAEAEEEISTDRPGTSALAGVLANPSLRIMLFAGARGAENAGDIALATAKAAAKKELKIIIVDIGVAPSRALGGFDEPGLADLLGGEAAFGEVIRRDDETGVHVIPLGGPDKEAPRDRLALVVGALTHTYDKVVIVADALADWPQEHLTPDCAAVVCAPEASDAEAEAAYDEATGKGARNVIIVRFGSDDESDGDAASAAA